MVPPFLYTWFSLFFFGYTNIYIKAYSNVKSYSISIDLYRDE